MTAPCILRLNKEISVSENEVARAILMAEMGCYLARIGDFPGADGLKTELRRTFGSGQNIKISIRIMILEGLLNYFQSLGGDSRDRLARAHLLSTAAKDEELTALTSAWLGHIQFNEGDLFASVKSAALALGSIESGQWANVIRLALLIGDLFLTVGNSRASKAWYSVARSASVEYGDQAAIGALTYNQAALNVFNLRVRIAVGDAVSIVDIDAADAETRTAINYQHVAGVTALEHLLTSSVVGIKMLREDYASAAPMIEKLLVDGCVPDRYLYKATLHADAVLCSIMLGKTAIARAALSDLTGKELSGLPLDDQLVIFSTLNKALKFGHDSVSDLFVEKDLEQLAATYLGQRRQLEDSLRSFEEIPVSLR